MSGEFMLEHSVPDLWRKLGALDDSLARRRCRERLNDDATRRLLERAGIGAGWSCVEVGAGTGAIAAAMAEYVGSAGSVLATELRPEHVQRLRAELPTSVDVLEHDCRNPLPGAGYDLIHARFVLEHLADRSEVLERLRLALRPGGRLVIEDALISSPDFGGHQVLARATESFTSRLARAGSNYQWARKLPTLSGGADHASVDYPVFAGGTEWAWFWASTLGTVLEDFDLLRHCQTVLSDPTKWFEGPAVVRCIFVESE